MNVLCHAISAIIWTLHRSNSGALCTMATVRTCKTRSRCSTLPGQYRAPGQGDGPRNGGSGTRLGDRGAVRARQHRASASAGPEAPQESFQTDGISAHPKNPKNVCCCRTAGTAGRSTSRGPSELPGVVSNTAPFTYLLAPFATSRARIERSNGMKTWHSKGHTS